MASGECERQRRAATSSTDRGHRANPQDSPRHDIPRGKEDAPHWREITQRLIGALPLAELQLGVVELRARCDELGVTIKQQSGPGQSVARPKRGLSVRT